MKSLLIVDDEPEVVEGLADILGELPDLRIHTAFLAAEALEVMGMNTIHIILADINMPGMNGLELCELIQEQWPETRIVFLSGVRDFDIIYRSIQNPTVRYLTKMEPDFKIQRTIAEVLEEISELDKQKHMRDIINRTFPPSVIDEFKTETDHSDPIELICSYIKNNLDKDLSLTTLGEYVNFNPHYLSQRFKEQVGIKLSDYVTKLRINSAHELVIHSNKKIHEIAAAFGYSSSHSFIRAYQKIYHMSPTEHRQQQRKIHKSDT